MSQFVIQGPSSLNGSISVLGSKNAALPLLAASLLTADQVTLRNIPNIVDVARMVELLRSIGVAVEHTDQELLLQAKDVASKHITDEIVGTLRGSVLLLGGLLGRQRQVRFPLPGGDIIGARPLGVHFDAWRQLGATVTEEDDSVTVDGSRMRSGEVVLGEFSVTATENILLTAAALPGTTTIHIAAAEPHVVALAHMLTVMGANVEGAGTHTIRIEGSESLHGGEITNIPDMLEAGLFILMAAATKSSLTVKAVPVDHLQLFFKRLDEIGINYQIKEGSVVKVMPGSLKAFNVQSLPYPGIATDLQAPFAVVATQANGSSLIHDPMYEDRFRHVAELAKMGANAVVCDPHRVIINGPTVLHGRRIPSLDIRSGATLIMAGMVAQGETVIEGAEVIDRGYADLSERLRVIGVDIVRVDNGNHT